MRSSEMWWGLSSVPSHLPAQLQSRSASEPRPEGRRAAIQRPGSTGVQASLPPAMATRCAAWMACATACSRALSFVRSLPPINTQTAPANSAAQLTLGCDRQEPRPPASAPLAFAACRARAVLRTPRAALMWATTPFRSPSAHRRCRFPTEAALRECSAARRSRPTGAHAQQERAVSLRERWTGAKVKRRVSVHKKLMKQTVLSCLLNRPCSLLFSSPRAASHSNRPSSAAQSACKLD